MKTTPFFGPILSGSLVLALATLGANLAPVCAQSTAPAPAPVMTPTAVSAPASTPQTAPEDPLVTARLRQQFVAWQRGRINRSAYSAYAGGTYFDALVKIVAPYLAIGEPQAVTYRTASALLGDMVYRYDVSGTSGSVSVLFSLDAQGKIDGIIFTPQVFRGAPSSS